MRPSLRYILLLVTVLAAAVSLASPTLALASSETVLKDCAEDGQVDGQYSDKELKGALKNIPTDLDEYSDCRALIRAEVGGGGKPVAGAAGNNNGGGFGDDDASGGAVAGASSGGGNGGSGEAEKSRARRELARQDTEQRLGDRKVNPATAGVFDKADESNGLPTPALVALIALAVLLAGGTLFAFKSRPALPGALRRVRLPGRKR